MTCESITPNSKNIVKPQYYTFKNQPLECGKVLSEVTICYETYGTMSPQRDNAILLIHALSGSAHAAGYHSENDKKPGWWDEMIGPGRAFDTDRYCIVALNSLGSCYGTTGPTSVNPETQKVWGGDFPAITIRDMVNTGYALMQHLQIEQWACIAGGSMGGMQVLQWAIDYPHAMRAIMPIATTYRTTPEMIGFNYIARRAIMDDPLFNGGNYDPQNPPKLGLSIARMLGHMSYLCDIAFENKFQRKLRKDVDTLSYNPQGNEFDVESYLEYQGTQFVARFDANTYLVITRAIDYYDLTATTDGDLEKAFQNISVPTLLISFDSDWLYPPETHQKIADAIASHGVKVQHHVLSSPCGHDAFLIESAQETPIMREFLNEYTSYLSC